MPQYILNEEDVLKKGDFTKSFEKVVELILKVQKRQAESIAQLESTYATLLQKVQNDHATNVSNLKEKVNSEFIGEHITNRYKEHQEMMVEMKRILSANDVRVRSLKDGKDADEVKVIQSVTDALKKDLPQLSGAVRDGLERLKENERLDKSAIRGLDELETKVEAIMKVRGTNRILAGPNANAVQYADLSSQVNSSATTYNTPKFRNALLLITSQFPFILRPTVDFTIGNGAVSLVTAQVPALTAGQTLILLYTK